MTNSTMQLTGQQFADRIGYDLAVLQSQTQAARWNLGTVEKDEIIPPSKIKAIIERVVSIKRGDAQDRVQKANALHVELFGTPAKVVDDVPSASAPTPQYQEQIKQEWARRIKELKAENAIETAKAVTEAVELALLEKQKEFDAVVKSQVAEAVTVQVKAVEEKHELQKLAAIGTAKGDMSKDLADAIDIKVKAARQEIYGIYSGQIAKLEADKKRLEDAALQAADKFADERRFLTGDTKTAVREERDRVTGEFSVKIAEKDAKIRQLNAQIASDTTAIIKAMEEKDAEIAQINAEIAEMSARLAVKWYQKITSFDVVNILSNCVAFYDILNLLRFHPVSYFIASVLVLGFLGVIKTLKSANSKWSAVVGMVGVIAVELVYSFVFTVFLKDVLRGRENLGNITSDGLAFYASAIFAAMSVFAAFMTLLKTIDLLKATNQKAVADTHNSSQLNLVTT